MKPETILLVGFGNGASGFGRVTNSMASALTRRHSVVQVAVDLTSPPVGPPAWPVIVNDGRFDPLGMQAIARAIDRYRPAVVWMLNDFWWLDRYAPLIEAYRHRAKFVAYVPLDGEIVRAGGLISLASFDAVAVYTEFARRDIGRASSPPSWRGPRPLIPELRVIPHGIDFRTFHKVDRKIVEASRCFSEAAGRSAAAPFLVLNGNQNNARKQIGITLRGFAEFARGKPPGVKLVLNCSTRGASRRSRGIDVERLAQRLGIADRLILKGSPDAHSRMPDEELNLIYNCCDVGLNTSWGEGWGLVSCEHGATGAAQIVCRHTACSEIWDGHAEMLPTDDLPVSPGVMLKGSVPSPSAVASALERLYGDREHLAKRASQAQAAMRRNRYDWANIGRMWSDLFEEVAHS